MRRISLYTLTIIFLFTGRPCTAQQVTTITNPKLELRGNRIHIIYDILNSDSTERFDVRMEITDSAGLVLDAKSLTGDIGESVPGGADREIVWSFQADQVNIQQNFPGPSVPGLPGPGSVQADRKPALDQGPGRIRMPRGLSDSEPDGHFLL
jgi:hypothetical protein